MPDGTDASFIRTAAEGSAGGTGPFTSATGAGAGSGLGRYRIVAELSRTGRSRTFSGYDPLLTRRVAVTAFSSGGDVGEEFRRWREARILAGLEHPGLLQVYDAGDDGHRGFVITQLVTGPTLAEQLRGGRILSPSAVVSMGADLAGALDFLHRHGLVHRSLTARRVQFDVDGRVFLTGLDAAAIDRSSESAVITADDLDLDAVAHLAPEQDGSARAGPAADVYALGRLLLECLGSPPRALASSGSAGHEPSLRPPVPSGVPAALGELLTEMVAELPEDRPEPGNAAGRLHRLGAALLEPFPQDVAPPRAAQPLESRPDSPNAEPDAGDEGAPGSTARARRPPVPPLSRSRWRAGVAIAGIALVAALAGALGAAWTLRTSQPPRVPPAQAAPTAPAALTGPPTLFGRVLVVVDPATVVVDVQGRPVRVVVLGLSRDLATCAYPGAMAFAHQTLDEQTVTLVPDPTAATVERQAYVVLGSQLSYTDAAIAGGWASPSPQLTRYTPVFQQEEQRARDSGAGMFGPPCRLPS